MICFLLYFSQNYFLKIIKISVWTKKKVSFKNFYDLIFMIVSPSRYFRVFMSIREKSVWGARELCHFFNPFFASFCSKRRIPAGERVKAPSSGDWFAGRNQTAKYEKNIYIFYKIYIFRDKLTTNSLFRHI